MASTAKQYGVSFVSGRHPHPTKTMFFDSLAEAQGEIARLAMTDAGALKLIAPDWKLIEHYATKGGLVLMLLKDNAGYYSTQVWRNVGGHRYFEQVSLHKSKRRATSQLMSVFSGLCIAERSADDVRIAA